MLVSGVGCADTPELFLKHDFSPATLARTANHYIAIGEDAAKRELYELAPDDANPSIRLANGELSQADVASRVSWMCLILWPAKEGVVQRPPGYGALPFLDNHMQTPDWPLYPLVSVDASYFVLGDSYLVGGVPESPRHYLSECESRGAFRKEKIVVPTRAEAQSDLLKLRESPAWKKAWASPKPGEKGNPEALIWPFIEAQAKAISD
jgi:hypothetical protein